MTMKGLSRRSFPLLSMALILAFLAYYILFATELFQLGLRNEVGLTKKRPIFIRKLLQSSDDYIGAGDGDGDGDGYDDGDGDGGETRRDGQAKCSKADISIFQGSTAPMPNGIPAFSVEIINASLSCSIGDVHVKCGWFSSVRLVNPSVFRRVDFDDCLVNDGNPIAPGQTLSFQYANSFSYPLSVSSVAC